MTEHPLGLVLDQARARREGPVGVQRRQRHRLGDMVQHARRSSPFYRSLYRGLPERVEDAILLPVVDKPTLMARFDDWVTDPAVTIDQLRTFVADPTLIGQQFLGRYQVATTSGTTGSRGIFLLDSRTLRVAGALGLRMLSSRLTGRDLLAVVRSGGRTAMVVATGGHFASAVAAARLRSSPARSRRLSVLSVHTPLSDLVRRLNWLQPAVLAPYATAAALLAAEQHAGRLNITPTLVVLAAEGLGSADQERIRTAFPTARVVSSYAATECPFLSFSCPEGWLHVNSDWVILEPVTTDHQPVRPGEMSDTALLTNLANRVQPILRYDLGDRVQQRPDPCPCGSPFPAIRVQGRAADLVSFPGADGQPVTLPPLALASLAETVAGLDLIQVVQTTSTHLRVRIRTASEITREAAWCQLYHQLTRLLADHQLDHVTINLADEEPQPTQGGKYRTVIPLPGLRQ